MNAKIGVERNRLSECGNDYYPRSRSYPVHPATEALIAIGPASAPRLVESLVEMPVGGDAVDLERWRCFSLQAIYALGEIGATGGGVTDAIARSLIETVCCRDSEVKQTAHSALGKLPRDRVHALLLEAIEKAPERSFERLYLETLVDSCK